MKHCSVQMLIGVDVMSTSAVLINSCDDDADIEIITEMSNY